MESAEFNIFFASVLPCNPSSHICLFAEPQDKDWGNEVFPSQERTGFETIWGTWTHRSPPDMRHCRGLREPEVLSRGSSTNFKKVYKEDSTDQLALGKPQKKSSWKLCQAIWKRGRWSETVNMAHHVQSDCIRHVLVMNTLHLMNLQAKQFNQLYLFYFLSNFFAYLFIYFWLKGWWG